MDRILLEGMTFFGHHGVYPVERELGTHFTVDVELRVPRRQGSAAERTTERVRA